MPNTKNVHMFMGVNGVGKSTLTEMIGKELPNASIVHASQELRRIFGVATQLELEELSPSEKLKRRTAHLLEIFRCAQADSRLVVLDTHLLVPIRKDGAVRYENTWAEEYNDYVAGAYMLKADPVDIREWRKTDMAVTGRRRDLSLENIEADQHLNIGGFTALIERGALPDSSRVIANRAGIIHDIGMTLMSNELSYLR